MRIAPKILLLPPALLVWVVAAGAQPAPLPPAAEILKTCQRAVQLIDSTGIALAELGRAGEPVAQSARQTLESLRAAGAQNSPLVYSFLISLRAYLALSDSVPKPASLAEEPLRQFHELRDTQDRLDGYFRALLAGKEGQLRAPDRDALGRHAEANRKVVAPEAGRQRVVFLGDSITDLWRLNEYFPPERDFLNRGIGGQITGQMLGRMMADVIDLKPAAMVVLAGTNDIARAVPPEAIRNNLAMIAQLAEANKIIPIFASLLPISDYHKDVNPAYTQTLRRPPETILALNNWLRKYCQDRKYIYVDYYAKTIDAAGFLQADLSDDGLHPNAKGYRIMAPVVLEAIDKVLHAPPPAPKKRSLFGVFGGKPSEPRP